MINQQLRPGKVILLNGCSSAGKTTLAKKLQQMLPEPYQHISLDQFRDGLPDRVRGLNSPAGSPGACGLNVVPAQIDGAWTTAIQFGPHGDRILAGMRRAIASLSELGCGVIADDLLFKRSYLEDYARVLAPETTWFVGVRVSLEIAQQRETLRPGRFPGTATNHFDLVHSHGVPYDLEVDTSLLTPRAVAQRIIERLQTSPSALAGMQKTLQTRH